MAVHWEPLTPGDLKELRAALSELRAMKVVEGWVDPKATGLTHSYTTADFWLDTPDLGQNTVPALLLMEATDD